MSRLIANPRCPGCPFVGGHTATGVRVALRFTSRSRSRAIALLDRMRARRTRPDTRCLYQRLPMRLCCQREHSSTSGPGRSAPGRGQLEGTGDMTVASGLAGTSEDIVAGLPTRSVVVPTRNESGNIAELLARLSAVSVGTGVELIFVDDSDDDTSATIERGRRACA